MSIALLAAQRSKDPHTQVDNLCLLFQNLLVTFDSRLMTYKHFPTFVYKVSIMFETVTCKTGLSNNS